MYDNGTSGGDVLGGDGIFTATLSNYRTQGNIAQFYVEADVDGGEASMQPKLGSERPAMFIVDGREMPDTLRGKGWSDRDLAEAANYLTQPGISVVEDARIAQAAGEIHALHDPTEGGVATALVEIATASGVDLDIDADTLPISPLSQRLCDDVGIDPFGAISSGALLIGCTAGTTRT